jgi:hypothetical protein
MFTGSFTISSSIYSTRWGSFDYNTLFCFLGGLPTGAGGFLPYSIFEFFLRVDETVSWPNSLLVILFYPSIELDLWGLSG